MSPLRPHAVIPMILMSAGIIVSASESLAAARDTSSASATRAHLHHAHHDERIVTNRIAHNALHRTDGGAVRRDARGDTHRVAVQAGKHADSSKFDPSGYTCAHPTLPFGTRLRVADPKSGRSVVVTVNDRGPFVHGRTLDVSLAAARALGMIGRGVMRVEARVI
jgi:expansin (peptidoglycan-binding protein)